MAHALENGTVSPDSVKKRLVRVPTTLNSHLMRSALTHPDTAVRRRALAAMARLEVPNFAREFLEKLGEHIERDLGLAHIREALGVDERDGAREHGGRSQLGHREADAVDQGRNRHADEAAARRAALDAEARLSQQFEGPAKMHKRTGGTSSDAPPETSLADTARRLKAIFIGSAGNLVEWFDFYAYSAFALYFAKAFFPVREPDRAAPQRGGDLRRRLPDAARSGAGCSVTSPIGTGGAWR